MLYPPNIADKPWSWNPAERRPTAFAQKGCIFANSFQVLSRQWLLLRVFFYRLNTNSAIVDVALLFFCMQTITSENMDYKGSTDFVFYVRVLRSEWIAPVGGIGSIIIRIRSLTCHLKILKARKRKLEGSIVWFDKTELEPSRMSKGKVIEDSRNAVQELLRQQLKRSYIESNQDFIVNRIESNTDSVYIRDKKTKELTVLLLLRLSTSDI